jgi:hypothetical protein
MAGWQDGRMAGWQDKQEMQMKWRVTDKLVAGKLLRDVIEWGLTSKSRYISCGLKKDIQNANNRSRVPTDR